MSLKPFFHYFSSNVIVQLTLAFLNFFTASVLSVEEYGHYNILIMLFSLLSFFHLDYVGIYYIQISQASSKENIRLYISNFIFLLFPISLLAAGALCLFKGMDVLVIYTVMMLNQFSLFYINYLRAEDRFSRVSRLQLYNAAFRVSGIIGVYLLSRLFGVTPSAYMLIVLYGGVNFLSVFLVGTKEENFYRHFIDRSVVSIKNFIASIKEGAHLLGGIYLVFFLNYLDRFVISLTMGTSELGIVSYYKLFGGFIVGILGGVFNGYFYPKIPKLITKSNEKSLKSFFLLLGGFSFIILLYNFLSPPLIILYTNIFAKKYVDYTNLIVRINLLSSLLFFMGIKNILFIFVNKRYYLLLNFLSAFIPIVSILILSRFYSLKIEDVINITLYFLTTSFLLTSFFELYKFSNLRRIIKFLALSFTAILTAIISSESYINIFANQISQFFLSIY